MRPSEVRMRPGAVLITPRPVLHNAPDERYVMHADLSAPIAPPPTLRVVPIPDKPGYHACEDGSIWSRRRTGPRRTSNVPRMLNRPETPVVWRKMKPRKNWAGYERVCLS